MNDIVEVLITSDGAPSGLFSSCVWDLKTGTIIHSYKNGGVSTPNTLCPIKNDYILAAEHLKPLLHLWPINSQEPVGKNIVRLILPRKANSLDVSSNGMYCAAGIDEKLYIWQLATGRLLAIANKHFQPITKVLFSADASHIITAGEDGLVLIWSLAHLIITAQQQNNLLPSQSIAGQADPIHTISDHSMSVKDMYVSKSGERLITVSSDRTLKLYQLVSGKLLLSVVFNDCLTSVTLNHSDTHAYVGTVNGNIYELSFLDPPRQNKEYHYMMNKSFESKHCFVGHSKSITCLTMTIDSTILVSGSTDCQVIVWHVGSKQKLRTIPHKGAITNLRLIFMAQNLISQDLKPSTIVKNFERINSEADDCIPVIHRTEKKLTISLDGNDYSTNYEMNMGCGNSDLQGNHINYLMEINKLKAINAKLYEFTVKNIINSNENKSTLDEKVTITENVDNRKRKST